MSLSTLLDHILLKVLYWFFKKHKKRSRLCAYANLCSNNDSRACVLSLVLSGWFIKVVRLPKHFSLWFKLWCFSQKSLS